RRSHHWLGCVTTRRGRSCSRVGEATMAGPSFGRLWRAGLAVNVAVEMQAATLGWAVIEDSGSAFRVGTVAFVLAAPTLVMAALGGRILDRVPVQRLLVGLSLVLAAQATALALLWWRQFSFGIVLALGVVGGFAIALRTP